MNMNVLFPISIANRTFSTENVRQGLANLPPYVSKVTFLVADWLQLYNKVNNCSQTATLGSIIRDYNKRNKDLEYRHKWLEKLLESSHNLTIPSYEIFGMEHYFDAAYANVFRNINILKSVDKRFSRDITNAANLFFSTGNKVKNDVALKLSEQYILEEIALNIRIRVIENIHEEYYFGSYPLPMIKIYTNSYLANAKELTGNDVLTNTPFKFFSIKDLKSYKWEQVII